MSASYLPWQFYWRLLTCDSSQVRDRDIGFETPHFGMNVHRVFAWGRVHFTHLYVDFGGTCLMCLFNDLGALVTVRTRSPEDSMPIRFDTNPIALLQRKPGNSKCKCSAIWVAGYENCIPLQLFCVHFNQSSFAKLLPTSAILVHDGVIFRKINQKITLRIEGTQYFSHRISSHRIFSHRIFSLRPKAR